MFLVLLRMAIGWHFLYEGMEKVNPPDGKPFSAEGYLRNSTGPLSDQFRGSIPDVYGLDALARDESGLPAPLKDKWDRDLEAFAAHYDLTSEQKQDAEEALHTAKSDADAWFRDVDNAQKVRKYEADLKRVLAIEHDPEALEYQRNLAFKDRVELNDTRKELLAPIEGWDKALHGAWEKNLNKDQQAREPIAQPWTELDWINASTKWGLIIAGGCLLLGFLTPLAGLWGAAFLTLIYMTMPPWPGLPPNPVTEGHYLIVNKNLVELLACLVIATTGSGHWIGLDALFFGWIGRRRRASDSDDVETGAGDHTHETTPHAVSVRRRGT